MKSAEKLNKCPICGNSGASFFMTHRYETNDNKPEQELESSLTEDFIKKHEVTVNNTLVTIVTNKLMCSRFCPHLYAKYEIDAFSRHTTNRFCGIFNVKLALDKHKRAYRCKECINKVGI